MYDALKWQHFDRVQIRGCVLITAELHRQHYVDTVLKSES